jgi:hypothetical protein
MSVTATAASVGTDVSRNKRLEAEAVEVARSWGEDWERNHLFAGSREEAEAKGAAFHLRQSSYRCGDSDRGADVYPKCGHVFAEGEVVYRKRQRRFMEGLWDSVAICDDCVRENMHPSYREHREEPVPCAGGCGVLVSHWQHWSPIQTCSTHCSTRTSAERRRVKHDARRCEVCEDEFTPKRADARNCSNACRQDAYRKRRLVAA